MQLFAGSTGEIKKQHHNIAGDFMYLIWTSPHPGYINHTCSPVGAIFIMNINM